MTMDTGRTSGTTYKTIQRLDSATACATIARKDSTPAWPPKCVKPPSLQTVRGTRTPATVRNAEGTNQLCLIRRGSSCSIHDRPDPPETRPFPGPGGRQSGLGADPASCARDSPCQAEKRCGTPRNCPLGISEAGRGRMRITDHMIVVSVDKGDRLSGRRD